MSGSRSGLGYSLLLDPRIQHPPGVVADSSDTIGGTARNIDRVVIGSREGFRAVKILVKAMQHLIHTRLSFEPLTKLSPALP
jgi:hypothetical protein